MTEKPESKLTEVARKDGRYPLDAFVFLYDGLGRAVKQTHGDVAEGNVPQHVTIQQLCHALREEAIERWGLLARDVLARWNIRGTIDFGNMVYVLIENDLMKKSDADRLEDSRDVYDFDEAFGPRSVFKE